MELLISGPEGAPTRIELRKHAVTLGRSVDNDLAYPDDPWLSRSHLRFELHEKSWWIKDCASRNGTVLNSASLKDSRRIKAGDRIYAGHLTIEVRDSETSALRPVISFVSGNGGKVTREATLETSLDQVLGKSTHPRRPEREVSREPSLNTTRVIGALIRAGQELVKNQTLAELFEVILDLSLSAVEAKRGVILTLEDSELLVKASKGDGFTISTAVRDRVIREKCSLVISDAQSDDALRQQQSIVLHQVRSMMAAPLQTSDGVIGLIYVDNGAVIRPFTREDLDLLTVMANVAAIRIENARLAEIEHSEKIMELELSQASEIQKMLLPTQSPDYEGYDVAGLNLACRTVGGDYYDFLPYEDGRLAVMVGDVSGKGLPAALLMSSLQARVQMFRETSPEPGFAVTTLNRSLTEHCPLGKFITFFYGLLDGTTGTIKYTNAGHNYPLVLRKNGSVERLKGNGLVMGLFPTVRYEVRETQLEPGEMLVLYSDGVTEATTSNGKEFGEDGLAQFLATLPSVPCEDIVNQLVDHIRKWRGNTVFADDFTVVLVRRL
jgi:serine phosphatase RsbU (regulator of sigma subunit)/pSer/pThr/pTyr-binding forkhead associated (FHA) protein